MVNIILHGWFTDEYLASHTVSEATKTKQPLPAEKVEDIIGMLVYWASAQDPGSRVLLRTMQ